MASVADAILDAAATALGNVTWSPSTTATVKKRKAGTLLPAETESGNLTVVVSLSGGETVEELTASQVLVGYSLSVELAVGSGEKLGNTAQVLSWREQARKKLHARATWYGIVAEWNQTQAQPLTAFDRSALDRGVSLSLQRFLVETIESRGD